MVVELGLATEGTQDLANQPATEVPLHYLRNSLNDINVDIPKPTNHDKLLNRAFAVKCIAVIVVLLEVLIIVAWMFAQMQYEYTSPIVALVAGLLLCIPVMIQYYILNSVSVALDSSAELHGKIEQLQKKLENNNQQPLEK
jgi:hypothetical protein